MAWVENSHSRGEIDRAGDRLTMGISGDLFEYFSAYNVMDKWRASHDFPLNTLQVSLRRRANRVDTDAIVAQRMKRVPSIISKLRREDRMRLSRMQDLGGCRAIVSDVSQVYSLRELYQISRDRHELANERDYIEDPKDSGYRGIHLIFKYKSDRSPTFDNHRIEIQLRTKIQHAWATSVEIAGLFTNSPLKSSIGPEEWLDFFKLSSSAFSIFEGTRPCHDYLSESEIFHQLTQIENRLNARATLYRFSATHKVLEGLGTGKSSYYLLTLDSAANESRIEEFARATTANDAYASAEKLHASSENIDVVLVSSDNLDMVSRAYPNYFVDTEYFLHLIEKAI